MELTYCELVPEANRWKLDKQLDFEHEGVPKHLDEIANAIDEWEGALSTALDLTVVDVSCIKEEHRGKLHLQTRAVLHLWKQKKGLEATYRNLVVAFLKAKKTGCAEAVCHVLMEVTRATKTQSVVAAEISKTSEISKKEVLRKNEAKITQSFARLVRCIRSILLTKSIDMDDFRVFAFNIFPERSVPSSKNVSDFFEVISSKHLWSYSHYSPLETIAEEFAIEETQPLIDCYATELTGFYATTSLVDYIQLCNERELDPVPLPPDPASYNLQLLSVKLDVRFTEKTLKYVHDLWRALAKTFTLPSLTALLDKVVSGSLTISWWIPDHYAVQIRLNCTEATAIQLFRAHNIVEVKIDDECLHKCGNLQTVKGTCSPLLVDACKRGDTDEVLELLQKMTDFNFTQHDIDKTPLETAAYYGHVDTVQLLLLLGFDVDQRDRDGWTALMAAGLEGKTDVMELLLQHHADVNASKTDGRTTLMEASQEGRTDVVELLLQHHADINARTENGVTALMLASEMGRTDVLELLLQHHADMNARNEDGATALMLASGMGRTDVVELLLQHHADVNARAENGVTALMLASLERRTDVMKILLHHHADVNARAEGSGWTALMIASHNGSTDVVELLLQHHANVNARAEGGLTALTLTVKEENIPMVKLLLEANADANITETKTNWTPLFFAVQAGNVDLVQLLIDRGANVDHNDKSGTSAYDVARTYNHCEVGDLLTQHALSKEQNILNEDTRKRIKGAGKFLEKSIAAMRSRLLHQLLPERQKKMQSLDNQAAGGIPETASAEEY